MGSELVALNRQYNVLDREISSPEEDFALNLSLGHKALVYKETGNALLYGEEPDPDGVKPKQIKDGILLLDSGECVLCCSREQISMPSGYLGLIQTKGSLARLFVMTTCCDGQVEPGFSGKVTLELVNNGVNPVKIPLGSRISQCYIFRCSSRSTPLYNGRYQDAMQPTTPISLHDGK